MKRIIHYVLISGCLLAASCNSWLNVNPKEQTSAKVLLTTYSGFCDALNGCYINLKNRNIYGEKLTMSDLDCMAQLWDTRTAGSAQELLKKFDFGSDAAKSDLAAIYDHLYNTIAQANMIIEAMPGNGKAIEDHANRAMIEGEAYAIRAFCHFDVLRLFGQMPRNPGRTVSLPYAEAVSPRVFPPYYDYDTFVKKIEADLKKAEELLYENDPIFRYTFEQLNSNYTLDDQFLLYRQSRFNYWAVKALQARFHLYLGGDSNRTKAYNLAKEVINALNVNGAPLLSLNGVGDINNGYLACPTEALMQLNAYNIATYSQTVLSYPAQIRNNHMVATLEMYNAAFAGYALSNRSRGLWDPTKTDPTGKTLAALKKYYYDAATSPGTSIELSKRQVIPLLRLSEMFLAAIETTNDLAEANALWTTYMQSHGINSALVIPFTSLDGVMSEVTKMFRIEFYGEGQMFYFYKRTGAATMLNRTDAVTEQNYVVPLPDTEYDPNI